MSTKQELEEIRRLNKIRSQKGEFARRRSKLDPYRGKIFELDELGASLSEIKDYIVTNLKADDRKGDFKLHRTTIQKYLKRFKHG